MHPQWCIAQAPADQAGLARYCRFNGGGDSGKNDSNDAGKDSGDGKDAGKDAESPPPPPKPQDDGGAPPPPSERSQDERLLDQLENAPTVQREAAKRQKHRGTVRGSEDK